MRQHLNYLKKKQGIVLLLFVFCFSLVAVRWLRIPMQEVTYPPRSGTYGDVWSCLNVQSAARYFRDSGFARSAGLPVFGYNRSGATDIYTYTHYPPLPDELAGVVATLTGSVNTRVLSILPILVSIGFFGLILISLQVYNPNRTAALLAASLTLISCYFVCWADDIHQHVYGECLKWLFVLMLYRYYQRPERPGWLRALLCLAVLVNTWISFEPILYYAVVVAGFAVVFEKKLFTPLNFLLGLMTVLGLGLHLLQNFLYLGSWDAVVQDVQMAFTERTVGNEGGIQIGAEQIQRLPQMLALRFDLMYFIGCWPFIGLALLGFGRLWKENRRLFGMGVVLLLASVSWIFFMTQHAYIHLFTIRHFGLFYAFILSWGIVALWDFYARFRSRRQLWGQIAVGVVAALCLLPAIDSHFYYVYMKFGYLFPRLGVEHHLW